MTNLSVKEAEIIREANLEMIRAFGKIKNEIDEIYEELEVLASENLMRGIEESINDKKEGKLHGLEEFKKIVR